MLVKKLILVFGEIWYYFICTKVSAKRPGVFKNITDEENKIKQL